MKRLPDWRSRLAKYLDSIVDKPFDKSAHNCALFPADTILAMTDHDFAEPYRGKFKTYKEGLQLMKKDGYKDHFDMIDKTFTEIPVSEAKVGDIFLISQKETRRTCGVCVGHFALALSKDGLARVAIQDCYKAYAVGYIPQES